MRISSVLIFPVMRVLFVKLVADGHFLQLQIYCVLFIEAIAPPTKSLRWGSERGYLA